MTTACCHVARSPRTRCRHCHWSNRSRLLPSTRGDDPFPFCTQAVSPATKTPTWTQPFIRYLCVVSVDVLTDLDSSSTTYFQSPHRCSNVVRNRQSRSALAGISTLKFLDTCQPPRFPFLVSQCPSWSWRSRPTEFNPVPFSHHHPWGPQQPSSEGFYAPRTGCIPIPNSHVRRC